LNGIDFFEKVRVPDELEKLGLDRGEFGEEAYTFD